MKVKLVGSVVQCFKRRDCDRHSLGSKRSSCHSIVSLEKTLYGTSPAWWSCQAVLNYSHIS